jgi:hypothetical protein
MDIQALTRFFMWCTIINGSLAFVWGIFCFLAPDLVYSIQNYGFPMPREAFNLIIYSFLGLFKIFFLIFNLVPYLALLIMGRRK